MKRAGAIIRVSTARQLSEGTSPEKQAETIAVFASEQGFELEQSSAWILAESGNSPNRQGFLEALEAVRTGAIQRVYVFSVDRLGRNLREMLNFLFLIEDLGAEVWEAERRRRLSWDDFMLQIEGAVASKERQEIVRRTQDGLHRAIVAGKYSGGIVAYGYQLNPETKRLELDEAEATVVRLIFQWCIDEELSCTRIADRLNGLGTPTRYTKLEAIRQQRGKRSAAKTAGIWRAGRIRNMLRNSAYAGSWEWGKRSEKRGPGERIAGVSPPIVSTETLAVAARVLASNRWLPGKPVRRKYLLRGLIHCADCGHAYCGSVSHIAGGERRYYRCNLSTQWHKLGRDKCMSKSLPADQIEDLVWADVKRFIQDPKTAITQLQAQRAPIDATLGERLADVDGQLKELARRERSLLRVASEAKELDVQALDDVLREVRTSEASLKAYRTSLAIRLQAGEALDRELFKIPLRLASLEGRIDQASFDERQRAVRRLVKGIEVRTKVIDGRRVPHVSITYHFQDLGLPDVSPFQLFTYGEDRTGRDSSPPRA